MYREVTLLMYPNPGLATAASFLSFTVRVFRWLPRSLISIRTVRYGKLLMLDIAEL